MATYAELQAEIERLKIQAEQVRKEEIKAAISEIRALMTKHGITLKDLGAAGKKTTAAPKAEAQYRDEKTGEAWSGRGRKPQWLKDRVAQGKSEEDYKVKPAA